MSLWSQPKKCRVSASLQRSTRMQLACTTRRRILQSQPLLYQVLHYLTKFLSAENVMCPHEYSLRLEHALSPMFTLSNRALSCQI